VNSSFFQSVRFPASIAVLFFGWFLVGEARSMWTSYWLLRDRQQGSAVVTKEHGHNVVDYSYRVNGKAYRGTDRRRYLTQEHRYVNIFVGGEAVVYFSSSHPWLSALTPPDNILPAGFPGTLLFLAMEIWFLITLVNPNSRWAYKYLRRPVAS
jgi:hypothetical protein